MIKPLGDEYSEIEPIAFTNLMDNVEYTIDQMPLLAARISTLREGKTGEDAGKDKKLMEFLAKNKHMTPFEHVSFTFRIVAPISVFREWHRHRTQSYNEMSMRYVRAEDQNSKIFRFYIPKVWRIQSKANKQGSGSNVMDLDQLNCTNAAKFTYERAKEQYLYLASKGVASELCRIVLPVGTYSEMYATANLRNWKQFCDLRMAKAAQWEIRQYAISIDTIFRKMIPDSWAALNSTIDVPMNKEQIQKIISRLDPNTDIDLINIMKDRMEWQT